jgi:hypothetical protein
LKRIEDILTGCIDDVRSSKTTIDECLARYPELRQELEPLLKTALSINKPPAYHLESAYKQSARANLLRQIRPPKRSKVNLADIISLGIPRQLAGVRAAAATLVIVIVISMVGGGTAFASQSTAPGDVLYTVKISTENFRLLAAGNAQAKAELGIEFASRRMEELSLVAGNSEVNAQEALSRYRHTVDAAIRQLQGIKGTSNIAGLLENIGDQIDSQISTSDSLIDDNPVYVQQVIEANSVALNGQVQILQILARYDSLKAAEYNVYMMQSRLQRALTTADAGQYQHMELRLQQYQELVRLGEYILSNAETLNDQAAQVKALALQQLPEDLETLEMIAQNTPAEYQGSIENCTQATVQFQQRAGDGQQDGNGPGSGGDGGGNGGPGPESPADTTSGQGGGTSDNGTSLSPTTSPGGSANPSDNQTGPQNGMGPGGEGSGQGSGSGGPP